MSARGYPCKVCSWRDADVATASDRPSATGRKRSLASISSPDIRRPAWTRTFRTTATGEGQSPAWATKADDPIIGRRAFGSVSPLRKWLPTTFTVHNGLASARIAHLSATIQPRTMADGVVKVGSAELLASLH